MIRAVLWDADGVLQRNLTPWEDRVAAVIGAERVPAFAEELWAVSAKALVGEVDFARHIDLVLERQQLLNLRDDLLATWRDLEAVRQAHDVVARVRRRVPCYLASNQDSHRSRVMREHLRYDDLLDGYFFSCEVGAAKPDEAFFEHVVGTLGVPAGELLFVDDLAANVAAARVCGLRAEQWHHDDGIEALDALLADHGL